MVERTAVHISDDAGRIAMLEHRTVGTAADDNYTAGSLTRFIYSNHLQSASLELDEDAAVISYEKYHPYGTTAYQANNSDINAVAKRYRYTCKERDEESGLYYHGARYYIPWLCRWTACDPLESKYAGWSPYHYVKCNPVMDTDSTGMGGDDDMNLPKGVRNGGVAGGFTAGSEVPATNSGSSKQPTQGKQGVSFNALRMERMEYDTRSAWALQPEVFQNNMASSFTNSLSDGVEFVGNFFSSEGRKEDLLRTKNVMSGVVNTIASYELNKSQGTVWDNFYKPILTDPRTYEDAGAGIALGYAVEGTLSVVTKLPKVAIGFSRGESNLRVLTSQRPIKVELMGGPEPLLNSGVINYDIHAKIGIADDVANFPKYFKPKSVSEVTVNNPQAIFLQEISSSLKPGADVTIRGTMSNKYFNNIWNNKAEGLSGYETIQKLENVPNRGYKQTSGKPIQGTINQIILRRKK